MIAQAGEYVLYVVDVRGIMPYGICIGDSAMFEKLLLAAALTLSLHIFPGVSASTKLPKSLVVRSSDGPTQTLKLPFITAPVDFKSNVES